MRKIAVTVLFFVLASFISAKETDKLANNYRSFAGHFKKKQFEQALKYVSSYDLDFFKELEEFEVNEDEQSVDSYMLQKLEAMWMNTYDQETRVNHLDEINEMLERDIPEMKKSLEAMQEITEDEDAKLEFEKYMEHVKKNAEKEILLTKAKSDIFGSIRDLKVIKNRAVLVYNVISRFRNKSDMIKLKNIGELGLKYSFNYKIKQFFQPVVVSFIKEQGIWKIVLFANDKFDYTGFEKILEKYTTSTHTNDLGESM